MVLKTLRKSPNLSLLVLLLVAIWWVVPLWMYGVFDDGVFYASIARNLIYDPSATIWDLKVSNALDPVFNGHPPLAFWLQSLFFAMLGDAYWVERVYGLCMAGLTLYGIQQCWQLLHKEHSHWALLVWLTIPVVAWSYANNILENTLTVWTTAAVWWMLYSHLRQVALGWTILGSTLLIFFATMVKGPVGLFPLATWGIYTLVLERPKMWGGMALKSCAVIIGILALYGVMFWMSPKALYFYERYWRMQLETSLSGQDTIATSRFFIVRILLEQSLPFLGGLMALWLLARWRALTPIWSKEQNQKVLFWGLLGAAASLPMMISPKQLWFYLVPSTVFYGLAAGAWLAPLGEAWYDYLQPYTRLQQVSRWIWMVGLVVCISLSVVLRGKNARHPDWLGDSRSIGAMVPPHTEIYIHPDLYTRWNLHGYLYRYFYIDISAGYHDQPYALMPKDQSFDRSDYQLLNDSLQVLRLYQKK